MSTTQPNPSQLLYYNPSVILKNYLLIAFRSLLKQRSYALINIAGLSISLAVAMLILLWVQDEWNMDKFHVNGDRIYRLKRTIPLENNTFDVYEGTPYPLLSTAQEEFPEVEKYIPLGSSDERSIQYGATNFRVIGSYANRSYFEVFSYPILLGDISQLDKKINALAISENLATKIFGNVWQSTALGEVVHIHDLGDFSIEAVYADFPQHSSIQNDFMYPLERRLKDNQWMMEWGNSGMQGAILLSPDADVELVRKKVEQLYFDHQEADQKEGCILQLYADDYLYGQFDKQAKVSGGRIEYVGTFTAAALLLLIIACINFVNLATARSFQRAKEVGVRKTVGAGKKSLVGQFMAEAGLISLISVGFALVIAAALLPKVRLITEKMLKLDWLSPQFWFGLIGIAFITTLLSGAYPAFVIASFRPVGILKGKTGERPGNINFRKVLVAFQFILALLLIVGALVVQQQVTYIRQKNLGINKDNLVVIRKDAAITGKYEALRNELLNQEGIEAVTTAGPTPIDLQASTSGVSWPGKRTDQENIEFQILWAESDFPEFFEVPMAEGRFYHPGALQDTFGIVLNKKAIEIMGLKDPVGQTIQWWRRPRQIIGVTEDFHNRSLYDPIEPVGILLEPGNTWSVFVKAEEGKTSEAVKGLKFAFDKVLPDLPLYYEFVDEQYQENYKSEVLTGKLANYFAIISILISCLGLFGLATLLAAQRIKEIGIRRVLGASVAGIVGLLSKEFLKLVLVAVVIGVPLAYYLMNLWLTGFAYHIDMQWWVFLLAGITALVVAFLTVGWQSMRAAMNNPVESLRQD